MELTRITNDELEHSRLNFSRCVNRDVALLRPINLAQKLSRI